MNVVDECFLYFPAERNEENIQFVPYGAMEWEIGGKSGLGCWDVIQAYG